MSNNTNLPHFQHIDTKLGLKYLNGNKKLYLKILNNFLERYQNLKIDNLNSEEFKDTIHTIKGLSATLGMVSLSSIAKIIHETANRGKIFEFSKSLALVIDELQTELKDEKRKTILIVDNISEDIDMLIDFLDDRHDIIVALNEADAIETITTEEISLVLLYTNIEKSDLLKIYKVLKQKLTPTIFMVDSLDCEMIEYSDYIKKPLNKEELEKYIKTHF
jgi:HPt (histidine-containing phosphotransfer) domain-containing protein